MFGSAKKDKVISRQRFFCPKCDNVRPYVVKHASVDFTFYFIPLFKIGDLDEFVVCPICKKGFDPEVLEPENQHLFRLAWTIKCGLRRSSGEALRAELLGNGFKEPLIDKLVTLAQI